MPAYTITNDSANDYVSDSLSLAAGDTTIMTVDFLPADLHNGIINEILVVVSDRHGISGGGGVVVVTPASIPASNSSVTVVNQGVRKSPGAHIYNNTTGNVALRVSLLQEASFVPSEHDVLLEPGEGCYVAADTTDPVKAICETTVGTLEIEVFS